MVTRLLIFFLLATSLLAWEGGSVGVQDPYIPSDGTMNITGAFAVSGDATITGGLGVGVANTTDGTLAVKAGAAGTIMTLSDGVESGGSPEIKFWTSGVEGDHDAGWSVYDTDDNVYRDFYWNEGSSYWYTAESIASIAQMYCSTMNATSTVHSDSYQNYSGGPGGPNFPDGLTSDGVMSCTSATFTSGRIKITPQSDYPANPIEGDIVWKDSDNAPMYYSGSAWSAFGGASDFASLDDTDMTTAAAGMGLVYNADGKWYPTAKVAFLNKQQTWTETQTGTNWYVSDDGRVGVVSDTNLRFDSSANVIYFMLNGSEGPYLSTSGFYIACPTVTVLAVGSAADAGSGSHVDVYDGGTDDPGYVRVFNGSGVGSSIFAGVANNEPRWMGGDVPAVSSSGSIIALLGNQGVSGNDVGAAGVMFTVNDSVETGGGDTKGRFYIESNGTEADSDVMLGFWDSDQQTYREFGWNEGAGASGLFYTENYIMSNSGFYVGTAFDIGITAGGISVGDDDYVGVTNDTYTKYDSSADIIYFYVNNAQTAWLGSTAFALIPPTANQMAVAIGQSGDTGAGSSISVFDGGTNDPAYVSLYAGDGGYSSIFNGTADLPYWKAGGVPSTDNDGEILAYSRGAVTLAEDGSGYTVSVSVADTYYLWANATTYDSDTSFFTTTAGGVTCLKAGKIAITYFTSIVGGNDDLVESELGIVRSGVVHMQPESEMEMTMAPAAVRSVMAGGMTTDVAANDIVALFFANNADTNDLTTYHTKLIVQYVP